MKRNPKPEPKPETRQLAEIADEMRLMIEVFLGCIKTGLMPVPGSPCHRIAEGLVAEHKAVLKKKRDFEKALASNEPLKPTMWYPDLGFKPVPNRTLRNKVKRSGK